MVWCAASIVSFSELLTTLDTGVSKVNENEILPEEAKRLWVRWSLFVSIHLPEVLLTEGQVKGGDEYGHISGTDSISDCSPLLVKKRLVK